jgi:hypothetical protein
MWEGTVGGHWGLFDAGGSRDLKYPAGEPITNFPVRRSTPPRVWSSRFWCLVSPC